MGVPLEENTHETRTVTVVGVQRRGSDALTLIYRAPDGRIADEILFRHDEARLEIVAAGRPWSFDGDGALYRLVAEAHRIRLAHLFDPLLAVHTSLIEPLPHQITAAYEAMLPRQPLRFLLADDPGAGKTIMAGLLIKELIARGDVKRCLIVCPGSLVEQWQDELAQRFHLPFDILTNDGLEAARSGNRFLEHPLAIARLDKPARNDDVQQKPAAPDCRWDLVVVDEAHKMSATFFGGEVKYTKRYRLGQLLSGLTRHFLLMTATPHNGKEEDFQLFLALLDGDRFEGRFRDGVHQVDVSDLMRRMVKEKLLKFDGRPLFPERIAYTVPCRLSDAEAHLYREVAEHVRQEWGRAEALNDNRRAGTVGFALTILQRRLASSPEAIYQSLRRRRERLEQRLREEELLQRGALDAGPTLDADEIEELEDAPDAEAAQATCLYQDGARFWYATQPTAARLAEDRAEQLKRDPDRVFEEVERRLREHLRQIGDFRRIHALPRASADVPDERETRLAALAPIYPYSKEPGSAAEVAARDILEKRGNAPRLCRNALVFLAADRARLQDLADAVRRFLAWSSILDDREALDLSPHQVRQAEAQRQSADQTVTAQLPETCHRLLVPEQKTPSAPITWQALRLSGHDALAVQASRRLKHDELLITALGATALRDHLDRVPLWRGDHVTVRRRVDDFAQYLYLPRLAGPDVLLRAARDGVALLTWQTDSFAYAEGFDEATGRCRGLRGGEIITIQEAGMLVKPDVAQRQIAAERAAVARATSSLAAPAIGSAGASPMTDGGALEERAAMPATGAMHGSAHPTPAANARPRRFHGSARLDPLRVGRDAARIAEEIIARLLIQGAEATVTLEIQARLPEGASEQLARIVSENSRALRFESHGFESE